MTTATAPAPPARRLGIGATITHTAIIARRNLIHLKYDPVQIIGMTVQPLMFLLLFVYVFGGAIAGTSRAYLQFALPGFLVQAVAFASMQTAVGLNADFQRGVIDRFRSLNMARPAVIAGRVTADLSRITASVAVLTVVGTALGFRFHGSVPDVLLGLVLTIGLGFALCWLMAALGMTIHSSESVSLFAFLTVLPLSFGSSVFAPPQTMPGWLQPFVRANPVSVVTNAGRDLMLDGKVTIAVAESALWIAAIIAVFAPLVVVIYRRRD